MPLRDLSSYVSTGIARTNPFEGGPAYQAWQNASRVMPDTWGGYVSRLAEHLDNGETTQQLLGKLCIPPEALRDPAVHFRESWEFMDYQDRFKRTTYREAEEYFAPEVKRLQTTFDAIAGGCQVPDQAVATQEADRLQADITSVEAVFRQTSRSPFDFDEEHSFDQTARCMRRDALSSGKILPLTEFVATTLEVHLVQDPDFRSELAPVWIRAVKDAVDEFGESWGSETIDMPVSSMVVGQPTFGIMRQGLSNLWPEQEAHRQARWDEVKPVFMTNFFDEHPLIAGRDEK